MEKMEKFLIQPLERESYTKMKLYIKCLDRVAAAMCRLVLFIVSGVFFITCSFRDRVETNKDDCNEIINKSLLLHEIKNEILKEYIAQYDSTYNEGEQGILINCEKSTFNYEIKYTIAYYDPSTWPSKPMIKCEPINGREVIMTFSDYGDDVELAADKALELNRDALLHESYKEFKEIINSNKKAKQEEHVIIINDKVSISLTFDTDQNLIQVDTLGFW